MAIQDFLQSLQDDIPSLEGLQIEDVKDISLIVLEAIRGECTEEEFNAIMESASDELELYNVINMDNDTALEGTQKVIKVDNWKQVRYQQLLGRCIVALAKKANDPKYEKYKKYTLARKEIKQDWKKKYGSKAAQEAKRILKNARNKTSQMKSDAGKSITSKIDRQIKKIEK